MKEYRIGIITLIIAVVAIIVSLVTPEVRQFFGLDKTTKDTALISSQQREPKSQQYPVIPPREGKINKSQLEYRNIILNEGGEEYEGVVIYCSSCDEKKVVTDNNGLFTLKKTFSAGDPFLQTDIVISKGNRTDKLSIDWRDQSPTPIKF